MTYKIAEKFKSLQGEGVYAGTPMAFIRFVGCSVGKTICQHCDTDFDKTMPWRGGGEFTSTELISWASPHQHVCFTGGEPFDQDLKELYEMLTLAGALVHVETSGTVGMPDYFYTGTAIRRPWICVSPKPGFLEQTVRDADEVKVIVPGLGEINEKLPNHWTVVDLSSLQPKLKRWPDLSDALRWADAGKIVFLQPRNGKTEIDKNNLMYVMDLLRDHPQLRLSAQLHKILKVQ